MPSIQQPWQLVQAAFNSAPVGSQVLNGKLNIYVERYICPPMQVSLPPLSTPCLATQLGGAKVGEGGLGDPRTDFFPSVSAVIPANCPTEWEFSGFIDFAVFYFPDTSSHTFCKLIHELTRDQKKPLSITNPLIAATSQQITEELSHSKSGTAFVERLMLVMLEQSWRLLNGDISSAIKPGYIHLGRIQEVISFIQNNLDQPLTIELLAAQIDLSPTHFRRIFTKATGVSAHQFIINLRLKRARELLTNTDTPIIHIAEMLGFNSQSHFTALFKKQHAITPHRYRQLFISL